MAIKKGIYAASMSIFNQDLSLDIESTIRHSERLIKEGLHGAIFFGSTGCAQLISSKEKKKLIDKLNKNKLKDHFIIGTGANALNENIELMKHSLNNGIDRFLLMPPAYYKYGDDGAYSFYANIVQKIPESKIILYNFEKLSGYKFSENCVEKLATSFPKQIIGVKDSSYNLYEVLKIKNFSVFPGSESKLLKGLELGCKGIITATTNVTGSIAREVYDNFLNNSPQNSNQKLCDIRASFEKYNLISGLHTLMSQRNSLFQNLLPPLKILSENEKEELLANLKKFDFKIETLKAA